jgi:hypothetical protein
VVEILCFSNSIFSRHDSEKKGTKEWKIWFQCANFMRIFFPSRNSFFGALSENICTTFFL